MKTWKLPRVPLTAWRRTKGIVPDRWQFAGHMTKTVCPCLTSCRLFPLEHTIWTQQRLDATRDLVFTWYLPLPMSAKLSLTLYLPQVYTNWPQLCNILLIVLSKAQNIELLKWWPEIKPDRYCSKGSLSSVIPLLYLSSLLIWSPKPTVLTTVSLSRTLLSWSS